MSATIVAPGAARAGAAYLRAAYLRGIRRHPLWLRFHAQVKSRAFIIEST